MNLTFPEVQMIVDQTEMVYHYTSLDSAKSILESKKIWATSMNSFKDQSEVMMTKSGYEFMMSLVEEEFQRSQELEAQDGLIEELRNSLTLGLETVLEKQFFIVSFCLESSNGYLWSDNQNYARRDGVAIGFKTNYKMDRFFTYQKLEGTMNIIVRCRYGYDDLESRCRNVIGNLLRQSVDLKSTDGLVEKIVEVLISESVAFKDSSFKEEHEIRAIGWQKDSQVPDIKQWTDSRDGNIVNIPYVEMDFDPTSVSEIWFGPEVKEVQMKDFKEYLVRHLQNIEGVKFSQFTDDREKRIFGQSE